MEEVIAEKSTSYIITMTLCCLICLGAVIFLIFAYGGIIVDGGYAGLYAVLIVPIILLLAICAAYGYFLIVYIRYPEALIVHSGDKIIFLGRSVNVADIVNVGYRHTGRGFFHSSKHLGVVKVKLKDGSVIKCYGVPAAEEVHDRLFALVCENASKKVND